MKNKVYHDYLIAYSIILLALLIVPSLSFYKIGLVQDSVVVAIFCVGSILAFSALFMWSTHGGLFDDTVYVDEEKIVINKKHYQKTLYWEQIQEIEKHNIRGSTHYNIVRFGSTKKEQELSEFTCSLKFKKYMYSMFEQAKKKRLEEYKNRMQKTEAKTEA